MEQAARSGSHRLVSREASKIRLLSRDLRSLPIIGMFFWFAPTTIPWYASCSPLALARTDTNASTTVPLCRKRPDSSQCPSLPPPQLNTNLTPICLVPQLLHATCVSPHAGRYIDGDPSYIQVSTRPGTVSRQSQLHTSPSLHDHRHSASPLQLTSPPADTFEVNPLGEPRVSPVSRLLQPWLQLQCLKL